jgi:hypothetical protein
MTIEVQNIQNTQERLLVNLWIIANATSVLTPIEVAQIRGIIDDALVRHRGEGETQRRHRIYVQNQNLEDPKLLFGDHSQS